MTDIKQKKMEFLKLFQEHTEYETYINGSGTTLPNVSLCAQQNEVHYNRQFNKDIIYKASAKLQESTSSEGYENVGIYVTALDATIESHTFENGVGTVKFETNLTTIGKWAFLFTEITEVIIPKTVTNIGIAAFGGCTGLTSVTIEATTPPTLGISAFNDVNCTFYVPAESVNAYKESYDWSGYASRIQAIP